MEFWIEREWCTACGACVNICSANAIQLRLNETGCAYPAIDKNTCTECGRCRLACPIYRGQNHLPDPALPKRSDPTVYAAWSYDYKTRYTSTSGGVFSELAKTALRVGAYVAGAAYDENQMVHHIIGNTEEILDQLRQSKYVQSNIGLLFRDIRTLLEQGEWVLFCGTPCQVAGLYGFLGSEHENLITIDFVCRGNNSPMVYRAWLDDLEREYGAKATKVTFKDKEHGWKNFSTRVAFSNGRYYCKTRNEDMFMRGYLKYNLFIRQSCTQCEFKGVPRKSDITLADFWGVKKELDSNLGTSLVLINSEKGEALFDRSRGQMIVHKQNYEDALKGNPCMVESVVHGEKREEFLSLLKEGKSFSQAFRTIADETDPMVSVIVPVNSASQYLGKTIDSVLEQEYKQLEVLLICGSADKALQNSVAQIAAHRPAVRLLSPVGDITCAIDAAITEAKGEYIHILTGREELYPGIYRSIIDQMKDSNADIACFGWANAQKKELCRNAFCGTGNAKAFLDLMLTEPGKESDYSGYGRHLWNRIFRKDILLAEGELIGMPAQGFAMTELFWQIQLAFCCDVVMFLPSTMMVRFVTQSPFEREFSSQSSMREFFDLETQALRLLEAEPRAYNAAKRIFCEYELRLLFFCRQQNLGKMSASLMERLTVFHEIAMDSQETMDAHLHMLALEQTSASLTKKATGLESKLQLLKEEKTSMELNCASLQNEAKELENKLSSLQDEKAGMEKKCHDLAKTVENQEERCLYLEQDRSFLKENVTKLEKDRAFLKGRCAVLQENVKDLETVLSSLQDEKSGLEEECSGLAKAVEETEKRCSHLEQNCSALRENVAKVEEDRAFLKGRCAVLQENVKDLETALNSLRDEKRDLEEDRAFLKGSCTVLRENTKSLESDLKGLRDERNLLEKKCAALAEAKEGLEKDRSFLKRKNQQLECIAREFQGAALARAGLKVHRQLRRIKAFFVSLFHRNTETK